MDKKAQKLVIISSYPAQGTTHGKSTVGVASYTKNTLLSLSSLAKKNSKNIDISVLGEKLTGVKNHYKERGIRVHRIWERNSLLTFPILFKEVLLNQKNSKKIIIALELTMFGHPFNLVLLPLFLFGLRLINKKVIVIQHQVLPDLGQLSGHIDIVNPVMQRAIWNTLVKLFYKSLYLTSSQIIVFENALKLRLGRLGGLKKIKVIQHGVEKFSGKITKDRARMRLGISRNDFVVLYFGFLAWYKGTDWLVDAFPNLPLEKTKKKIKLVIAGGPNPNHIDKKNYLDYIKTISIKCKERGFIFTGFIPENKIPFYFTASDVVVFPYRTLMSASGPLSLALSFRKPFLLSKKLEVVLRDDLTKKSMKKLGLNKKQIIFPLNTNGEFTKLIKNIALDNTLRQRLTKLSKILSEERSWERVGRSYYDILSN